MAEDKEKLCAERGNVSYDVQVVCPHCGKDLWLNQFPYNDDEENYAPAEDELGMALFGTDTVPAKWNDLKIQYKCCKCQKYFILTGLEI